MLQIKLKLKTYEIYITFARIQVSSKVQTDKMKGRKAVSIRFIKIVILPLLTVSTIFSQQETFDEQEFFRQIETSYYTLNSSSIKNLTSLVTSLKAEDFAKENWNNSEIFPLQLIWFKPDKLYLSQTGVPKLEEQKRKEYDELIAGLKQQFKGILVDLQRFYITGLFESISSDYKLRNNEEAVQISYTTGEGLTETNVKYLLGKNGLCLEIVIHYPAENKSIYIFPAFRTVKTKWLIESWKVQTLVLDEVVNGFEIKLNNQLIKDVWVPIEIVISVQKIEDPDNKYYDMIMLRNFLFDQSIELLKK